MFPAVTVIIPTYNWATVLPYSIASVLDQTFDDLELLVVGDGCTDESAEVVARIASTDARVRWINLFANTRSQSAPNNEGNAQARGDIIAYLGHDDLWFPDHLQAIATALETADVAHSRAALINPQYTTALSPVGPGQWVPPTIIGHRRGLRPSSSVWLTPDEAGIDPEIRLLSDFRAAGALFAVIDRITAVKLPALYRKGVYQIRPHHEQEHWLRRIRNEPDLAVNLRARCVAYEKWVPRPTLPGLANVPLPPSEAFDWSQPGVLTVRRRFKGLAD